MKKAKRLLTSASLAVGALAVAAPAALAGYTPACTAIKNHATVDFQVGGVQQAQQGSKDDKGNSDTTFNVGVKVDVLVQPIDQQLVTVYPGSKDSELKFKIINNGNAPQKYVLSWIAEPTGTADPISGTLNDSFDGTGAALSQDTIASLAPEASQDIILKVSTPLSQTNGKVAVYGVKAQSQWVGSSTDIKTKNGKVAGSVVSDGALGACTALGSTEVDVVAADAKGTDDGSANDGAHSARGAYVVSAAALTVTKTSAVYWDPVNLTSSPKAIPGAVVTYTVAIENRGSDVAQAENVGMVDNLSSEIDANHINFGNYMNGAGNTSFKDADNDCTGSAGYGIVIDGVCKSNAFSDNDGASWNDAADPTGGLKKLAITGLTVPAGQTRTIKYQTTIR